MVFEIRPVISALMRNWMGPALVAAQVAVALAVLVNSIYIVKQRMDKMDRPSGMDVENIFMVRSAAVTERFNYEATTRAELTYLRGIPGVVAAMSIDYPPLSGNSDIITVALKPDDQVHGIKTFYYEVDDQAIDALGLHLIAGRGFRADEILPPRTGDAAKTSVHQVMVTKALADLLYPQGNALGKPVYDTWGWLAGPATIVGIVDRMQGARLSSDWVDRVVLSPRLPYPDEPAAVYLVRTQPGQRGTILRAVEAHLQSSNPDRMIEWIRTLEFFKNRSYQADRNMEAFLIAVIVMLGAITCIGIYGLATFNVSTRTKQIGTRRALGATRTDIVNYFLVENWLVMTAGIVFGCVLTVAAGNWLSRHYALPKLDLRYLVGVIPVLWIVALLAAWNPARRASVVSPATATRSV